MKKLSRKRASWHRYQQKLRRRLSMFRAGVQMSTRRVRRDQLIAPSYFCLVAARHNESAAAAEFLAFLRTLRTYRGSALCIDLSKVNRLIVNATLLFKAEVSHALHRGVKITALPPKKPRSLQVLTQTGLTRLLNLRDCDQVDREDTVHWRHASGTWSLAQPSRLAALLDPGVNPDTSTLYRGMIESVANCIEHAYKEHPERRKFAHDQEGWWGFQQVRDGRISTCICDLGIGISRALPIRLTSEPDLYRTLLAIFRHVKGEDVKSILAAIEYGRSSTGDQQRGKGLRDAHRVIDDAGEGDLHIFSNGGLYYYRRERGKANPTSGTRRLQGSIAGTIYYWQYPLQSNVLSGQQPEQGALK